MGFHDFFFFTGHPRKQLYTVKEGGLHPDPYLVTKKDSGFKSHKRVGYAIL